MRARLADTAAAKQADVVQAREARRERALHSRAALLARRGDDGAGTDTTVTDGGSESAPEVETTSAATPPRCCCWRAAMHAKARCSWTWRPQTRSQTWRWCYARSTGTRALPCTSAPSSMRCTPAPRAQQSVHHIGRVSWETTRTIAVSGWTRTGTRIVAVARAPAGRGRTLTPCS